MENLQNLDQSERQDHIMISCFNLMDFRYIAFNFNLDFTP